MIAPQIDGFSSCLLIPRYTPETMHSGKNSVQKVIIYVVQYPVSTVPAFSNSAFLSCSFATGSKSSP